MKKEQDQQSFATNADPAVRGAWLDDKFLPPTPQPSWRRVRRSDLGPSSGLRANDWSSHLGFGVAQNHQTNAPSKSVFTRHRC